MAVITSEMESIIEVIFKDTCVCLVLHANRCNFAIIIHTLLIAFELHYKLSHYNSM